MTTIENGQRDEAVAQLLWQTHPLTRENVRAVARKVLELADKPRTVATVEELDALPGGAVIVDGDKNAHKALKRTDGTNWWGAALTYTDSTAITLPATLLGVVAND